MARKSEMIVTGEVVGTPNRELIFNIYRKYGVPRPSYLREEAEKETRAAENAELNEARRG